MTFRKLQRFLAAGMVTTMVATTVLGGAPIDVSKAAGKVAAASEVRTKDTINGVNADDEGVYKVTMDDTGYITADEDNNVAADVNTPFSWDNANVYFVLTDRFLNGDESNDHAYGRSEGEKEASDYKNRTGTFHGGDLAGLTKKLEEGYFDKLGTNAIWITAPYEQIHGGLCADKFKHYSYHGYYVLDYTNVDGNMGTEEELEKFIDTAHAHGIRVVFDVVMNHAGYADAKTASEYGFGKLVDNWKSIYYETSEKDYQWYHDYVGEASKNGAQGMMDPSGDWTTNWWGSSWIRAVSERFSGYTGAEGDGLEGCLNGLPDFKTETTNDPGLPGILKVKWEKEGTLAEKTAATKENMSKRGLSPTVTGYIATWLSDWVEKYGVDGFRCDTAKHVSPSEWGKLNSACDVALKNWRKANPTKPGAQWTDDFWMTGEHWGHGVGKDSYYTTGGFDSMINFDYQCNYSKKPQEMEEIYSSYASKINSDPEFNVLSYISSHDTPSTRTDNYKYSLLSAKDGGTSGISMLLLPGGVQTYYGDESGRTEWRTPSGCTGDQIVRSDMNWDSIDTARLTVWQKVGRFRRNHIAVGAGQHKKLAGDNYTFSRVYEGKATVGAEAVTDYKDAVVVCLPGKETTTDVTVGDTFGDATTVRDAYSGEVYDIDGDVVKNVKCDSKGVILLEALQDSVSTSSVSASPSGGTYKTDTVEITLKAKDATDTYYQIGDGEKVAYKDGDKITIGGDTGYEEETVIKLTGKGTDKDGNAAELSKELKFTREKEPEVGVEGSALYIRVKKADFTEAPQIYVYDDTHKYDSATQTDSAYTGAWPGKTMTEEGDYYVYKNDEITTSVMAIIFTADESWRSTPDLVDPDEISGSVEMTKGASSGTFEKVVLPTGDKCKVTINYIDQATDKKIKSIYRVGLEGDEYKTYEGSFAGYTLVKTPDNATGKFTKDEIIVNYYYTNGDTPVTETPSTETPVTETPSTETPSTQTPSTETPVTETPSTETPPTNIPVTEIPSTETPPTSIPVTETPSTEIPSTETPSTNVPTDTPTNTPTAPPNKTELSVKSFTSNVASPQTLGNSVTFKAEGQGGSGSYEYRFDISRIVNAVAVPTLKQAYSASGTLKWTPDIAGDYQITVRVKDTKTGDVKVSTLAFVINPKSTGNAAKRLNVTKFAATKGSGNYAVKLSAAATGGTGTKQYKFVRVYTSKGKLKYKTLRNYSTSKTTTWKAPKSGTYKFRVYVKDKKGLKVQVSRSVKIAKKAVRVTK